MMVVCDVMSSRAVKMFSAAFMSLMFLGEVLMWIKMILWFLVFVVLVFLVLKMICLMVVFGDVGKSASMTSVLYAFSFLNCGWSSWLMCVGLIICMVFFLVIKFFFMKLIVIFIVFVFVCLFEWYWSMKSWSFSTVNSMFCMFLKCNFKSFVFFINCLYVVGNVFFMVEILFGVWMFVMMFLFWVLIKYSS